MTADPAQVPAPVVALVGPTGVGKSDLAIELAQQLGGECINADSMQFYRGMDIGTAKVSPAQRQLVAHHLLDCLDLREEASVAVFQEQARQIIGQVQQRGNYPILVGGSGLYVRAALDLLEFPPTDAALRADLEAELAQKGPGALAADLARVDPISAARIKDNRRLVRALEVWQLTGRPFSSFMPRRQYLQPSLQVGLRMDRAQLHERLEQRVHTMLDQGLIEEVKTLRQRGLDSAKTASSAIGYRQFLRYLRMQEQGQESAYPREQARLETVIATRQFARRQLTWFRADPRVHWLDAGSKTKLAQIRELLARMQQGQFNV